MTGEFLVKDAAIGVLTAWLLAQVVLKIITFSIKRKRLFLKAAFMGGGMPSGHSTLVAALSTAVGLNQGFESVIFMVTVVFSIIIIYETLVTKSAIADFLKIIAHKNPNKHAIEQLGHSLKEVFAGIVFGIIVVFLFYYR